MQYKVEQLTASNTPKKAPPADWDEWSQRAGLSMNKLRELVPGFDDSDERRNKIFADSEAFAKWAAEQSPNAR